MTEDSKNDQDVDTSGFTKALWRKSDPDIQFWNALGKKIAHGPVVRIPDGYDARRRRGH